MMKAEERRVFPAPAEQPPKTDVERIGDQHALMMRYVRSLAKPGRKPGTLERLDPRTFDPEDYEAMAFRPDLYVIEPAAIDDLERAKAEGKERHVEIMRSVIRAMSWPSHGRTDDEVASALAAGFLKHAQERSMGHAKPQTGFEFADPDLAEWTRVLNALGRDGSCKGEAIEKPTRFVEVQIVGAWKELLGQFQKKQRRDSEWPTSYPVAVDPPKLSPAVAAVADRLVKLRHIRDQLYFWRLYPKHCMYAKSNIK